MPQTVLYGPTGQPLVPPTPAIVDPTNFALRASLRPLEYLYGGVTYGHYRAVGATTAIAPTANANLFALRFSPVSGAPVCVLMRLRISIAVVTAVTAARQDPIFAFIARAYSARDLTNAAAVVITGGANRLRGTMGTALMTNFDATNNTAGLTGGTKTIDTNAFAHVATSSAGTAITTVGTGMPAADLYKWDALGEHPVVLAVNEGVLVQWGATTLATGTVITTLEAEWAEGAAF